MKGSHKTSETLNEVRCENWAGRRDSGGTCFPSMVFIPRYFFHDYTRGRICFNYYADYKTKTKRRIETKINYKSVSMILYF